ncbi:MAG: hypothetical protein U5S82_16685 [Gammaproteobacteria bacterium]|nr:hypothetical protein [Gammaproteobacteria bacterium]
MLFSIDSNSEITSIPHHRDYERWRSRLTVEQYAASIEELNRRIEGAEIKTSSWIPGADWTETVFQPIYDVACIEDQDAAACFFGLIVWDTFMQHSEWWSFGRYEKNGFPIEGLTYNSGFSHHN